MKLSYGLFLSFLSSGLVACGGGSKKPATTPLDAELPEETLEGPAPAIEEEVEEPPPPLEWWARAELAPVKGVKLKRTAIAFHQIEGKGVRITSDLVSGLAPGIYHVVVHEAADCGKNATKIGAAWEPTEGVALSVRVEKGEPAELDEEVDYTLDGADSIVGRTFVLHADKKGKPGKTVACGAIVATGGDTSDEE